MASKNIIQENMAHFEEIIKCLNNSDIDLEYVIAHDIIVEKFSLPNQPKANSIMWIKYPDEFDFSTLANYGNVLIVTNDDSRLKDTKLNYIISDNSKGVFFSLTNELFANNNRLISYSSSAIIESKSIGDNTSIGHHSYIGPEVIIGNNVVIKHSVTIEGKVVIGDNVIIHSGTVIGSDGYGYFQINGKDFKIHHLGGVQIGDYTEIGSNTCIDRGTLDDTVIGKNVKIDNLCHVAHNVIIEDHVNVIALSLIAGSVKLKEHAYIAPSASIRNQLTVGSNSVVGLGAVVIKDVPDNVVVAGVPAKEIVR